MTNRERVLITGVGVIAPTGHTQAAFWESLLRPGAFLPEEHPRMTASQMSVRRMYPVKQTETLPGKDGKIKLGLASRLGLAAGRQALEDTGITEELDYAGISLATAMGDSDLPESALEDHTEMQASDPFIFKPSAVMAAELGLYGPNYTVSNACAAGLYSIALAVEEIRTGNADIMLAGGTEAFSIVAQGCFNRMGGLDPKVCRPYTAARKGTLFGEGAAFMVLESARHAAARSAVHVYAEILGFGWSCDGHHPTAPESSGTQIKNALDRALADADIDAARIDGIVPHGTGTELNDVVESKVIRETIGPRYMDVPLCAIKSKIGHSGGAAGAFSVLTAALIIDQATFPVNGNMSELDPRCRLNLPSEVPLHGRFETVLVNAYAFGGNNISVIFGKHHGY
jgi:3-oxoacyl-[acyl-carrier-protein] synthase II